MTDRLRRSRAQEGLYQLIYDRVRKIPPGRVATYGWIAAAMERCTPRMVGYAMHALPAGSDVAWYRVINSQGKISLPADGEGYREQRMRLEEEGVVFDERGRVDLGRYGWTRF